VLLHQFVVRGWRIVLVDNSERFSRVAASFTVRFDLSEVLEPDPGAIINLEMDMQRCARGSRGKTDAKAFFKD